MSEWDYDASEPIYDEDLFDIVTRLIRALEDLEERYEGAGEELPPVVPSPRKLLESIFAGFEITEVAGCWRIEDLVEFCHDDEGNVFWDIPKFRRAPG